MQHVVMGEWKVQIVNDPFGIGNKIYLFQRTPNGTVAINHKGERIEIKAGAASTDDDYFAYVDDDQLQALADGLANKGIKSSDVHRAEATLAAQSHHLEDMRRLVFKDEKGVSDEPIQPTK